MIFTARSASEMHGANAFWRVYLTRSEWCEDEVLAATTSTSPHKAYVAAVARTRLSGLPWLRQQILLLKFTLNTSRCVVLASHSVGATIAHVGTIELVESDRCGHSRMDSTLCVQANAYQQVNVYWQRIVAIILRQH